jgi:hypothetical protein
MSVHGPRWRIGPDIGDSSGNHDVPDPSRISSMPIGPGVIIGIDMPDIDGASGV